MKKRRVKGKVITALHISGTNIIHKKLEGDTQNLIIGMNPHPGTEVHLGAGLVKSTNNYQDDAIS